MKVCFLAKFFSAVPNKVLEGVAPRRFWLEVRMNDQVIAGKFSHL